MFDYRGLEALQAIITFQSFDLAAQKLYISQSAISQRLKALQAAFNDPLLIRTTPYRATEVGEYLLGHFKRVHLLESTLDSQISNTKKKINISIAINRDNLETWFMNLIESTSLFDNKKIEIIADDQDLTMDYLKKGLVTSCFSAEAKSLSNCNSVFLGYLNYFLVATPGFIKKYFKGAYCNL